MGIPSRLINVGCMMEYMRYTPRTLTELLDANLMPEIARVRTDGSAVEQVEHAARRVRQRMQMRKFADAGKHAALVIRTQAVIGLHAAPDVYKRQAHI